jgi:hypothetical protein
MVVIQKHIHLSPLLMWMTKREALLSQRKGTHQEFVNFFLRHYSLVSIGGQRKRKRYLRRHRRSFCRGSMRLPLTFASEKRFQWQQIFTLAQVLLGDNNVDRDSSVVLAKIDESMKLADALSLKAIVTSLQAPVPSLKKQLSPAENEKCLVNLFQHLLAECGSNISSSQAVTILRLVLILLARRNIGQDMNASIPGLLLLGVVTAHCAGYADALMEVNPRNVIMSAYFAALNELK